MAHAGTEREPWLPDLCRLPRLAVMLGVAELVVVVLALSPDGGEGVWFSRLVPFLTKWSMMDVLLVAIVIFATKTSGLAQAFTQPGLWFYAGSSLAVAALSASTLAAATLRNSASVAIRPAVPTLAPARF